MKMLRYGLLLIVLMGLVSMAAAADPVHTFTGTHDENEVTSFAFGSDVKDTVTSTILAPLEMKYVWMDETNDMRRIATVQYKSPKKYYVDVAEADMEGTWTVYAEEHSTLTSPPPILSHASFEVAAFPEFSFGAFVFLFVGSLYLFMRRKMVGS